VTRNVARKFHPGYAIEEDWAAREIPIPTHTEVFRLDQTNEALRRLKTDEIPGAAVLEVGVDDERLAKGECPAIVAAMDGSGHTLMSGHVTPLHGLSGCPL